MGMVEIVAIALWQAESQRAGGRPRLEPWADVTGAHREKWLDSARAAIEAMREPTEEMINAGLFDAEDFNLLGVHVGDFKEAYTRIISAALEAKP